MRFYIKLLINWSLSLFLASVNADASNWFSDYAALDAKTVSQRTNRLDAYRPTPNKHPATYYQGPSGQAKWNEREILFWSLDWTNVPESLKRTARSYTTHHATPALLDALKIEVGSDPDVLAKEMVFTMIQHLFCVWSEHVNLRIRQIEATEGPKEKGVQLIRLSFQKHRHSLAVNDHDFDGDGGVFAHAFAPPISTTGGSMKMAKEPIVGDIHFDLAEDWSVFPTSEQYIGYALLHEIGHSLGLAHANNQWSIMYNKFTSVSTRKQRGPKANSLGSLHRSDVARVKQIYSPRTTQKLNKSTCEAGLLRKRKAPSVDQINKDDNSKKACDANSNFIIFIICLLGDIIRLFTS